MRRRILIVPVAEASAPQATDPTLSITARARFSRVDFRSQREMRLIGSDTSGDPSRMVRDPRRAKLDIGKRGLGSCLDTVLPAHEHGQQGAAVLRGSMVNGFAAGLRQTLADAQTKRRPERGTK